MNKSSLAEAVQNKIGSTKKAADEVVDMIFDSIAKTLKNGDEVSISGFGIFVAKERKARTARNPRTGETVNVPAMKVPKFRASKNLKDAVK